MVEICDFRGEKWLKNGDFEGKRALASIVFPQPGGPYIKTPLFIHSISKSFEKIGYFRVKYVFFRNF